MAPHIVTSFDTELKALTALVNEMGTLVTEQIEAAAIALRTQSNEKATAVIASDKAVDALQGRIEELVINMIAKRQPLAIDLRVTVATLKIATDLERMGDLAKNNAKRVLAMTNHAQTLAIAASLEPLNQKAHAQAVAAMQAYATRDKERARAVWTSDGEIDTLHTALFRELLTYMMEDPRNIGHCTHLLFCSKNLERIGDHATNIAENVHYIVTGLHVSGDRPKGPSPSEPLPEALK